LGDYRDARDADPGVIDAMVSITTRPVPFDGPHFHFQIHDGQAWPEDDQTRLVRFIQDNIASTILIHCDAGISRSRAALVLWLMAVGFSQDDALQFLYDRDSGASPAIPILQSLVVVDLSEV
jgi:protein-tyrosine phosphatase